MMRYELDGRVFFVFPDVYEPADDSFLLAKYAPLAQGRVLDVGTGTGIQALSSRAREGVGIDINPAAVGNAAFNAEANGRFAFDFFESDLFANVDGKFDAILFNPPYLPTSGEDVTPGILDRAWNGGEDGRAVIDRFLADFPDYLAARGMLLMLHSSLAGTKQTMNKLAKLGMRVRILGEKNVGFETLSVLCARR